MPRKKARRKKARPKRRKRVRRVSRRKKRKKPRLPRIPATPVTKFLVRKKAEFEVLPQRKGVWKPKDIAKSRGRSVGSTVKCIILTDSRNFCAACVPGNKRIRTKKIQKALKTGRLEFVGEKHLRKLTGHMPGTVAPLALKKRMPVVFDRTVLKRVKVNISTGKAGYGVELRAAHLKKLADAKVADIKQ